MAKVDLLVTPRRNVVPFGADDIEVVRRLRPNTILVAKSFAPRNLAHHRKYRAMLAFVAANHPVIEDTDAVALVMKARAGFGRWQMDQDGHPIFIPRSTSFDECDQIDFDRYFAQCCDLLFTVFYPQIPDERKRDFLDEALRFTQ